jgi:hypothetical protein
MIVNLDKATFIVLSGSKVQLHFQDASVHMRAFKNRRELSAILDSWETQTRNLRRGDATTSGNGFLSLSGR